MGQWHIFVFPISVPQTPPHPLFSSPPPPPPPPPKKTRSTFSSGEFDKGGLFASSSNGFPSLGDGFPSIGGPATGSASSASSGGDGFPSIGEISSLSSPRRGVLIQNMPADSNHKIRILDREHKLGITGIVETIAIVKDTRFALCRTKERAAAIFDEFVFPVDVDSQQMASLIKKANRRLQKDNLELLWTAHTLTVRGLERPQTEYLSWKQPFNAAQQQQQAGLGARLDEAIRQGQAGGAVDDGTLEGSVAEADAAELDSAEEAAATMDRMDAAFFADVNDEDYAADAAEGLNKRSPLLEPEMLCEFEHNRSKFRVVVYQEPVSVLAQWTEDGTWRLLKSVEAELVEDAMAYKGLQNVDVELVGAE